MGNHWAGLLLAAPTMMLSCSCLPRPRAIDGERSTAVAAASAAPVEGPLILAHAFYGPAGYTNPVAEQSLHAGDLNAFSLWPPLDSGMQQFLASRGAGVIFTMAGASRTEGQTAESIEVQRQALARLRASGVNVYWNLMEEWDQSGGQWVSPRRPSYAGLSRRQAHDAFLRYYRDDSPPLGTYLRQPPAERGCPLLAQTDFPMNAFYAFELGADVCLLERGIDALGDLSTGIAFVRGAARQFERRWGIDLSAYRVSNQSPTTFDGSGRLTGGSSASYLRRHLYVAFLSGARVLQLEPASYRHPDGRANPLGEMVREFADFALRRHPDAGAPLVSMALMADYYGGFDPRHWVHCQEEAVWYRDIPYSDGDRMLDNFLKVAYPEHWLHGLAPGAPFADSAHRPDPARFKEYLVAGGDPRPYEPKGPTRWGDNLDLIGDNAPASALRNYKVIALVGDAAPGEATRRALRSWVEAGGTLVVNVGQAIATDEAIVGVRVSNSDAEARFARWLLDGTGYAEPPFTFTKVTPRGATAVLAATESGEPLVTANTVGKGQVILTTAHYLQSSAKDQLLNVGARLFDWLDQRVSPVKVAGGPIEYIVGRAPGKTLVTLVNNQGTPWMGTIALRSPPDSLVAKEYLADVEVAHSHSGGSAVLSVAVPAYDLKVFAFEER